MIYLLNGFLALLWLLCDHLLPALLIAPLAWLNHATPDEQRRWTLAVSTLAFLAALVTPLPVPLLLLVMAAAGALAIHLESFNTAAARWNTLRGLALYSLAGLGFLLYQNAAPLLSAENPLLVQGQQYLSAIAAFAMYLIPLGFLALLAQSLWAHPPVPEKPANLAHAIRARGKGR